MNRTHSFWEQKNKNKVNFWKFQPGVRHIYGCFLCLEKYGTLLPSNFYHKFTFSKMVVGMWPRKWDCNFPNHIWATWHSQHLRHWRHLPTHCISWADLVVNASVGKPQVTTQKVTPLLPWLQLNPSNKTCTCGTNWMWSLREGGIRRAVQNLWS